jgi:hypothetical protein
MTIWIQAISTVAYLPHTRTAEPQKRPFLSNTRTQQWNNGVMQPVSRQRLGKHTSTHDVPQQCLAITWRVFCRSAPKIYRGQQKSFAGSRKLEERVMDELLLSSEVPREQQSDQKKN